MFKNPVVLKEIWHISLGQLVISALAIAVCLVFGLFSFKLLLFLFLGSLVTIAGFVWLCLVLEKNMEKTVEDAKKALGTSYGLRMLLYGAWVVICVKFGGEIVIQILGSLTVLFPNLTIKVLSLFFSKNQEEGK